MNVREQEWAESEEFYRTIPDPELRREMLECIEVERAYERGELDVHKPAIQSHRSVWRRLGDWLNGH